MSHSPWHSEVGPPTPEQWQNVINTISQRVSREHATMFVPSDEETMAFFSNMPDIETVRKAAAASIAEANKPWTPVIETGKRKVLATEDDLVSDMPAPKKPFIVGVKPVMPGVSDVSKQGEHNI